MTRKHFRAIAADIAYCAHRAGTEEQMRMVKFMAERMADTLARTNPAFNRAIFLTACGV